MPLSDSTKSLIDLETAKFPAEQRQSAVISALRIVQSEKGWLHSDDIKSVAEYLAMPPMAAYEVATFYNMFYLEKPGKHTLTICTNLPCALSGGEDAAIYLKQKLGVKFNQTTTDGQFTLREGECMGACGDAPVLLHNNHKMCGFMTPVEIDKLLSDLRDS